MNDTFGTWMSGILGEIVHGPVDEIGPAVERRFAPDFGGTLDGATVDRQRITDRMTGQRSGIAGGRVEALDAVRDGASFAVRHLVETIGIDGSTTRSELVLFGELTDDDRIRRLTGISRAAIEEVSAEPSAVGVDEPVGDPTTTKE